MVFPGRCDKSRSEGSTGGHRRPLDQTLPRQCWTGVVHVNQLPAVPGLAIDLRFPTVRLNRCAVFALFSGEVPIELGPRGFAVYM